MKLLWKEHVRDPYLLICAVGVALAAYHLMTMPGVDLGPLRFPGVSEAAPPTRDPAPAPTVTIEDAATAPPIAVSPTHLKAPGEWWVDAAGAQGSDARTLAEIAAKLRAGDRIRLGPGEYRVNLRIDFNLEIVADDKDVLLVAAKDGPVIEQTSGTLKLSGMRFRQTVGDALISRHGEVILNRVAFLGSSGRLASFERSRVKGDSVAFVAPALGAGAPPVSLRLVDSEFDCAKCGFDHIFTRAESVESARFRLEDPVYRWGTLTLAGNVDGTILGATFLGRGETASIDSPDPELIVGDDANAHITGAVFDRSSLWLKDRAVVLVRASKFNGSAGAVVLAIGHSALRIETTAFAEGASSPVRVQPGVKYDREGMR